MAPLTPTARGFVKWLNNSRLLGGLLVAMLTACVAGPSGSQVPPRIAAGKLRIATWNMEYLVEPTTYAALRDSCVESGGKVPGSERKFLAAWCRAWIAVLRILQQWPATPGSSMRTYWHCRKSMDPVPPNFFSTGYDYCFTSRANVQKNGFAIRRGIPFRCEPEFMELSLDDRVRRGVVITLFSGTQREMTLMAVHLKSGCPAGPMTSADNPTA